MTRFAGLLQTSWLEGIAMGVPAAAAPAIWFGRRHARLLAAGAASVSAMSLVALTANAHGLEAPYAALMLLYAGMTLGACLLLPRRDSIRPTLARIVFLLAATLPAFVATNLWGLLVAWVLTSFVVVLPGWQPEPSRQTRAVLLSSVSALALATLFIHTAAGTTEIAALSRRAPGGLLVYGLLVAAVMLRAGLWPAQGWVVATAERGPALSAVLFVNANLGALLLARVIVPLFPTLDRGIPVISIVAIATAVLLALMALSEDSPRRSLALIGLSESACILVGLECGSTVGAAGALAQWLVVAIATLALFGILRLFEIRFGEDLSAARHHGLARYAPRLTVFFAVFGMALVGLPGTLGFFSQDFLLHGVLESHPWIGLLLPVATALNAVSLFRLFTRLCLGQSRTRFTVELADALPRERWTLTAGALFLVAAGLLPGLILGHGPAGLLGRLR